jgi:sigma-B regulation protein RsbU (phosphoserine phosphatase)
MENEPIPILLLEDNVLDAELIERELSRAGIRFTAAHVMTEQGFRDAVVSGSFDVILADYHLPGFSGMAALEIAVAAAPETPFLFVSGSIGEERAVEALRRGATDYIIKDRISRLPAAVQRARTECDERRRRIEAEEALRASRERFELAVQATRDVIWDWRTDGERVWMNEAIDVEWGHAVGPDVTLQWWRDHVHPDEIGRVFEHLEAALATGARHWEIDYQFRRGGGGYGHVHDRGIILRNAAGAPIRMIGAMQDITARVDAERELEREQRISSLGRIAAVVSHEFNNVLMGIQPFAEVIRRRAGSDEQLLKAAERILSSVERGRQITRDILRAANPGPPEKKTVDLRAWLREIETEIRGVLTPGIALTLLLPDRGGAVRCDPRQLQQVLVNLVVNSRDAIGITGELFVELEIEGGAAAIRVRDTGDGIDADVLPKIFEPLFTTKGHGTGLGLSVVAQLVSLNGGTIGVTSQPGAGTEFIVRFPLVPMEAEAAAPQAAAADPPTRSVRRLLLVEDDEDVIAGMFALLEHEGFELHAVTHAAQVGDAVREFVPDAVILDLSLPDGEGTDVYRFLALTDPDLPVIFASGHGDHERLNEWAGRRVAFLQKPYELSALLRELERIA